MKINLTYVINNEEHVILFKKVISDGINNSYHYSGIIFVSTNMIAGNASMPGYNNNVLTGNNGNGYARITNKN